jgi:hypothetical protein
MGKRRVGFLLCYILLYFALYVYNVFIGSGGFGVVSFLSIGVGN